MMNEQLKRADERAKAAEKKVMNKMMLIMVVVVVTRMTMLKLLLGVIMVVKLAMQPNKSLLPFICFFSLNFTFYRTRVRSLGMLVTNSLTD